MEKERFLEIKTKREDGDPMVKRLSICCKRDEMGRKGVAINVGCHINSVE